MNRNSKIIDYIDASRNDITILLVVNLIYSFQYLNERVIGYIYHRVKSDIIIK